MKCQEVYGKFSQCANGTKDFALLVIRVVIGYSFYEPAMNKWKDINGIAQWFDSMGMPLPTLNAYLAASTELLGAVLLVLGLFTRLISVPLMVVMVVAITMVHMAHGFSAGDNGFEIPLYYLMFLFLLFSQGGGKYSVDYFLFDKKSSSLE